jgi:hypothetical protein
MAPPNLNLDNRRREVANFKLRPLYPRKEPRYPLNRRLGGPQSRLEVLERKRFLAPIGIRTPRKETINNSHIDFTTLNLKRS